MTQPLHHPTQRSSRIPVLLYIPNILGYIRIIFAFIGLYYSILQRPILAILIWICASVLDMFDGLLARKLQQTSQFGILLDIVADNILRSIIYIATCNAASVEFYVTSTITTETVGTQSIHHIWPLRSVPSPTLTIGIILISCWIICMEWITMLSTQLYSVHQQVIANTVPIHASSSSKPSPEQCVQSPHWKTTVTTTSTDHSSNETHEWWIVQYYFSNNFCNPMGILGIYGLFASNLFMYGCYHPRVYERIPYYHMWMYLAFLGRFLSFLIELKFCSRFIHFIISNENSKKKA
jgi:CDP-diacylglycerol--inositol 3-phosphatidyltransferase